MKTHASHDPHPPAFSEAPEERRSAARLLFFDVDDTLTWHGQLPEPASHAIYRAHDAGLSLVAVTGRSYSWAEMLMRMFPFAAAVAETGAAALIRAGGQRLDVLHHEPDDAVRRSLLERRTRIADAALSRFPFARLALDNPGRIYDTAFDLIEQGTVDLDDAAQLKQMLEAEGLLCFQSSVHINAFALGPHGAFDKASMVDRLLRQTFSTTLTEAGPEMVYVGDSQNDGPLFAACGLSVGVGNVRPHLPVLAARGQAPRYVVDGNGGFGFAEVVAELLADR